LVYRRSPKITAVTNTVAAAMPPEKNGEPVKIHISAKIENSKIAADKTLNLEQVDPCPRLNDDHL